MRYGRLQSLSKFENSHFDNNANNKYAQKFLIRCQVYSEHTLYVTHTVAGTNNYNMQFNQVTRKGRRENFGSNSRRVHSMRIDTL